MFHSVFFCYQKSVVSLLSVIRCKYILIYLIKQINYEQNTKIDRDSFISINLTLQIMLYFHANEKSNIYIGEIIKNVMSERQVTKAELARRLDVKPQSVDYLLTRKSIDTDTLYNISLALDYDFSLLYSIKKNREIMIMKISDINWEMPKLQ